MRLIDADALIAEIQNTMCRPCEARGDDYHGLKCRACGTGDALEFVDDAPTLPNPCGNPCNFTRPTGKWKIGGKTTHYHYCSICGKDGDLQDSFCRNCGAKMEGEEE